MKKILIIAVLLASLASVAQNDATIIKSYKTIIQTPPNIQKPDVKIWLLKQTTVQQITLLEIRGTAKLHKHPDAPHSVMVLKGKILITVGDTSWVMRRHDFVSIPVDVPHKYKVLSKKAYIVSMDAPYYDPAKTIQLE